MSAKFRIGIFLASALALAALLGWGILGLPGFGHYPGPYGNVVLKTTVPERHVTDVVTSVMFDQRGLDTLGEEFILFAAVTGVILLLREHRTSEEGPPPPRDDQIPKRKREAVLLLGLIGAPFVFLFGMYITINAHISVGGGFQGGIVIAAAWLLLYLADERELFDRLAPKPLVTAIEALGAGAYAIIGFVGMAVGLAYLENPGPYGQPTKLLSGGTIPIINFMVGVEVAAAFILLMVEFLYEAQEAEGQEPEGEPNE